MKHIASLVIRSMIAILVGAGTLGASLHAQSDVTITARIPFPFTIDMQRIAPGTYRFRQSGRFELSMVNVATGDMELFAVHPGRQRNDEKDGRLIFSNSTDRRVLREVHFPGSDTFCELMERRPPARMEARRSAGTEPSAAGRR